MCTLRPRCALPGAPASRPSQPDDPRNPTRSRPAIRRLGRVRHPATGGRSPTPSLDRASDEVAVGLRAAGRRARATSSRLVLPPGIEYLVAYLAATKVGAITAGVNDQLAAPERARILELADPALVIAGRPAAADWSGPLEEHAAADVDRRPAPGPAGVRRRSAAAARPTTPTAPVAIIFTSGTTGTPRARSTGTASCRSSPTPTSATAWGTGGRSYNGTSSAHARAS